MVSSRYGQYGNGKYRPLQDSIWIESPANQARLIGMCRAFQLTRAVSAQSFPLEFNCDMTQTAGYTDLTNKKIVVNPLYFEGTPQEQWDLTIAVMVHEASHKRYTQTFTGDSGPLHAMVNILEDGRIERGISYLYPKLKPKLAMLAGKVSKSAGAKHLKGDQVDNPINQIIRWSLNKRAGNKPYPIINRNGSVVEWWDEVGPLLSQSFRVDSTAEVREIAKEILEIVFPDGQQEAPTGQPECCQGDSEEGQQESLPQPPQTEEEAQAEGSQSGSDEEGDEEEGEPEEGGATSDRDEGEETEGEGESESEGEGDVEDTTEEQAKVGQPLIDFDRVMPDLPPMTKKPDHASGSGAHLEPMPYLERLKKAQPLVRQFVDAMETDQDTEVEVEERRGSRFSIRNYLEDKTTPFRDTEILEGKDNVAVSVIVDCSGSMQEGRVCNDVTELAMAVYLASRETQSSCQVVTAPGYIQACNQTTNEGEALPLLGGMAYPYAGYEEINRCIAESGKWLLEQPEEIKVVFCLHDGMSNDNRLIPDTIADLAKKGVRVLGIGLNIRQAGLEEVFGKANYINMDKPSKVATKVASIISNMRRR